MQINSYTKKVVLICSSMIIVIIGLSVSLYGQGPRVRFIQNINDVSDSALTTGSNLQIVFDRPIEQRDYSDLIYIKPEIAFTAKTNTQNITLILQGDLQSDIDYTVSVTPEIYDKSGKKMKNKYQHTFSTTKPSYVYLERNYDDSNSDPSSLNNSTEADDHIKLATLGLEPEVVFSHSQIRLFAANDSYIVVAVKEGENDQLYTINLDTKDIRREQLKHEGRISNLVLAPRSKTALFTTRPDYGSSSPEYYEEYANRMESLDLDDGTLLSLTDVKDIPLKAYSINTDTDGQIALIQDIGQTYYAVSPFNDFDPILIGSYSGTFGFFGGGTEIIFRDGDDLVRYDIASANAASIELDDGYVLDIEPINNTVNFSSTIYQPGLSYSQVGRIDEWGGDPVALWQSEADSNSSLREFTLSYDNALLALQFDPDKCQYDGLGASSHCEEVFQQIFDHEERKVLREFRGSNLVWLP